MRFTDPIYYVGPVITQRKDQSWSTLKDLENSTFGTITGFALIPDLKRIPGLELKLYDTTDAAIRDLVAGRVDAIYADPPLVHWAIKQNPDWPIHYTFIKEYDPEYPVLTGRYGVVFAAQKDSENLINAFNEQIAKMWQTCENWKIAEKYGMAEKDWFIPPTVKSLRIGVDRPEGWKDPTLGADCAQ
jgi:ABC-type amino acid transport substrate-binding protein